MILCQFYINNAHDYEALTNIAEQSGCRYSVTTCAEDWIVALIADRKTLDNIRKVSPRPPQVVSSLPNNSR